MWIINDSNFREHESRLFDEQYGRGCEPRVTMYGDAPGSVAAGEKLTLIPRSEWPDRIKAKDAEHSWLEDLVRGVWNLPASNQGRLNYCWAFSSVDALTVQRAAHGLPLVILAAESLGGAVRWRNAGNGMDSAGAELRKGACARSFLDQDWSITPSRWKAGWEQDRLNHQIVEWWDGDIRGKTFDVVATLALLNIPCAVGFGWWSHAISGGYRLVDLGGGKFALVYRNNWGATWGDNGFVTFAEGKGTPDLGIVIPRTATISEV